LLSIFLVLALLLVVTVLTLPFAVPWLLQQQGIDFHWQNPQWHHNGFSVSQLQLTLPGDDTHPKQLQLENLRIEWALQAFPIQRLNASRVQIHWPVTDDQTPAEQAIQALPAVVLKWLPQHIDLQQIDVNLPGLGHLQGSLELHASAQGRLWQPAFIRSQLTLKDLQGTWMDSIPTQFRPKELSAQISTHPDHQDSIDGQQLLTVDVRSERPVHLQLTGLLDLQQTPDWKGALKNAELVMQLDTLAHPALSAEQLQARAYLSAQADADQFSISFGEHSILEAHKLQLPGIGQAEKAVLELAGLSAQGRSSAPHQIEMNGPIKAHLEELNAEQLHTQNWDFDGTLSSKLPQIELTGSLTSQHGFGLDSHIRLADNALQGSATLQKVFFEAGNPLEKTFTVWPEQISLSSGELRSQIDFNLPSTGPFKLLINGSASDLSGFIDKGEVKNLGLDFSGQMDLQDVATWEGTLKNGQIVVQLDRLAHPALHAEQLQARALFTAQSNAGRFTVSATEEFGLEAHKLQFPGLGQAEKFTMQLPDLSVQGHSSAPYEIEVRSPLNAHIEKLKAEQLHTQNWDINGTLRGQFPHLELTGNVTGQHGLSLTGHIRQLDNSLQGSATVKEMFFKAGNPLQKTFKDWPELVSFTSGRLSSKIDFSLPSTGPFKLSFNGSADGLNGIVNRSELKNLEVQFNAQLTGQTLKLVIPNLTIEQLDPGIPLGSLQLTNANYQATVKDLLHGAADWQRVQANVLNGKAWLDAQQLDLKRTEKLVLHVEGLELQELFKIYPAEGLAGTGIIDGQLPIHIERGSVLYIEAGQLQARQPGVLQFHSDKIRALGESNPAMRIVADALEDFHFNLLHSALSYDQSGKLLLNVRLEGRNPDVEKGRPIHLNINLEEDIPALLASIQLSGQVSEIIQKRIRERLEKR